MSANLSTTARCLQLSQKVLAFGTGINGRRAAQEVFRQMCEAANELGTGIALINYLPARSMRAQQALDALKCGQKVIYLLNLAMREGLFLSKQISEALQLAIVIENEVNALVRAYLPGQASAPAVAPAPEPAPEEQPAPAPAEQLPAAAPEDDPDGFNAPFEG